MCPLSPLTRRVGSGSGSEASRAGRCEPCLGGARREPLGVPLGRGEALLTFVPTRMPWRVAELQVDLAVLAGLGPAPAVASRLVGLEVNLGAEGMGELLGAAAALLAQEVLLPEVLTKICIVAGKVSQEPCQPSPAASAPAQPLRVSWGRPVLPHTHL